jgi:hypothetical protein
MNRRELIKGAAAATVTSALPSVASAAPNVVAAMDLAENGESKSVFAQGWFTTTHQYPDGRDFQICSNFWGRKAEIDANGKITLLDMDIPDDAEDLVIELHEKPEWTIGHKILPAQGF